MANASRFFGGDQSKDDPCGNSDNDNSVIVEIPDVVLVDLPEANKNDVDNHDLHMATDTTGWRSMNQQVLDDDSQKEDRHHLKEAQRTVILDKEVDEELIDDSSAVKQFTATDAPGDSQQADATKKEKVGGFKLCVKSDDHEVIVIDEDSEGELDMDDCQSCDEQQENVEQEQMNRNRGLTISIKGNGQESCSQGEITQKENPFAQFAFGSTSNTAAALTRGRNWVVSKQLEPKPKKAKTKKGQKSEWKPMAELSASEQERVRQKWHGLVVMPCDSSLEDARFQIMVASRLHARCQEAVVRKCMTSLHNAGVLTCRALAEYDVDALSSLLTSLQYYNTKSKHLVQASKELLQRFDGKVPELKDDLLTITGIGPVMADLLSTINSRAAHQAHTERASNTSTHTAHHTAFDEQVAEI